MSDKKTLRDYLGCCVHCDSPDVMPYKTVISNGDAQVWVMCLDCGKNSNGAGIYVPHRLIDDLRSIPTARDYSQDAPRCEVDGCDNPGELHHWAPRFIFENCWTWPMSYLCREHHRQWHARVTPEMARVGIPNV